MSGAEEHDDAVARLRPLQQLRARQEVALVPGRQQLDTGLCIAGADAQLAAAVAGQGLPELPWCSLEAL